MASRSLRSRSFRLHALSALALLALAASCTSDHGSLARRPDNTGGSGGKAGAAGSGGNPTGGKSGSNGGKSGGNGTGGKVTEPPGKSVLTLTHGIVDAPRVAWCFARIRDGKTTLVGSPVPKSGVAYGASIVLDELPSTDFERDALVAFAIAGELDLLADSNCEDAVALAEREMGLPPAGGQGGTSGVGGEGGGLNGGEGGESGANAVGGAAGDGVGGAVSVAGSAGEAGDGAAGSGEPLLPEPPRLRVGALPALPEGSLSEGYSLLLASAGCLGGPAFSNDLERQVCGSAYRPRSPTLTAELVVLSRKTAVSSHVFQTLHASVASGEIAVSIAPPPAESLPTVTLSLDLTEGMLRPREPRLDLAPHAYGAGSSDWSVQVTDSSGTPIKEHWPDILERSGIDELELGRGYTLIVIGPAGGVPKRSWWNAPAITLIDNDPEVP